MKKTFTQSMAWLHTWGGLLFGWLLFAVFFTGSLSVFDKEISHWMRPELQGATQTAADMADRAARFLQRAAPTADHWYINLPTERERALKVAWMGKTEEYTEQLLDPATGALATPRDTDGGHFLVHFHFMLNTWPAGAFVVAAAALVMLTAIVSGIVIHRRKLFRDIFTFRPQAASQRSWLDAHNAIGILLLPFHLLIAYSGLVIFCTIYMPAGVNLKYGGDTEAYFRDANPTVERPRAGTAGTMLPLAPLIPRAERYLGAGRVDAFEITNPGDAHAVVNVATMWDKRVALVLDHVTFDGVTGKLLNVKTQYGGVYLTQWTLGGLHFAQFGGYPVRWLYFLAGMASTAMIASGLVLFTVKRRQKLGVAQGAAARFYRLVEGLNVATVAGLMVAVGAYLWGNRLLPVDLGSRPMWERYVFYGVWTLMLIHALVRAWRTPARAWVEQLLLAAALAAGLPLVNAATTGGHLFEAIGRGDWMAAGVELGALGLSVVFLCIAARIVRRGSGEAAGVGRATRPAPTPDDRLGSAPVAASASASVSAVTE